MKSYTLILHPEIMFRLECGFRDEKYDFEFTPWASAEVDILVYKGQNKIVVKNSFVLRYVFNQGTLTLCCQTSVYVINPFHVTKNVFSR